MSDKKILTPAEITTLRRCIAGYNEYFKAIERGEYETNRRTFPLRDYEVLLLAKGEQALETLEKLNDR